MIATLQAGSRQNLTTRKQPRTYNFLVRYLIWDFDGTLAFREGGWSGAMLDTVKAHGIDCAITTADMRPHILSGFRWHSPHREYDGGIVADAWWDELVPLFTQAFVAACNFTEEQAQTRREVRLQYLRPDAWKAYADSQASPRFPRLSRLSPHSPDQPCPGATWTARARESHERIRAGVQFRQDRLQKPHPKAYTNVLATIPGAHRSP